MKNIGYFITILTILVACNKDSKNQNIKYSDNIRYQDLIPGKIIHSVRYFERNMDPESCGDDPIPEDSSAIFSIDMDGDSIADFMIGAGHSVSDGQGSIHCAHIIYSIGIGGLQPGDSISITSSNDCHDAAIKYDTITNVNITNNSLWQKSATLKVGAQGMIWYQWASFGDMYIGVKITNHFGWIHVEPAPFNGIIIKEFALNLTPHNSIKAGQKN
jgi:hypothetical protein